MLSTTILDKKKKTNKYIELFPVVETMSLTFMMRTFSSKIVSDMKLKIIIQASIA